MSMMGIEQEFYVFLRACLAGNFLVLVYEMLRVCRRIVIHRWWILSAEDFFFWIFSAIFLFSEMYHTSNGSVRLYFILGVVLGAFLTIIAVKILQKKWLRIQKKRGNMGTKGFGKGE